MDQVTFLYVISYVHDVFVDRVLACFRWVILDILCSSGAGHGAAV